MSLRTANTRQPIDTGRTAQPRARVLQFFSVALLCLLAACAQRRETFPRQSATVPPLQLDHAWIAIEDPGPPRRTLEEAGFRFSPTVNKHEGQGTASITMEFENGYFELIWVDDSVAAYGGSAVAKERFARRARWRETGDCPLGIGFHRTPSTPNPLPFETWTIGAPWMGEGKSMEVLSPRGAQTVTLFVPANGVDESANRATIVRGGEHAAPFLHPNGSRRLTGIKVSAPAQAGLPPAASFINQCGAANLAPGAGWLMELELDDGARYERIDFRPLLPLVIKR